MNKVCLTGYIANDIELKRTETGISAVSFSIAVKRPKKRDTTDFITVVCWRQTAEFVSRNFAKGNGIEVEGVLTMRKWTDKNGNNRVVAEVVADEVGFGKGSKELSETDSTSYSNEEPGKDDDFPF